MRCIVVMLALPLSTTVVAHEFWIMPADFHPAVGQPVALGLYVGQYFEEEKVPFSGEYVKRFAQRSASGEVDLTTRLPRSGNGAIRLAFDRPGTQLLVVDTHPNKAELSADQFNYYLADEGLHGIQKLREAGKSDAPPGRERYRRHIKTVIDAGGASDDTALQQTGQRMEIVPLANPARQKPGDTLAFRILFEGKPVPAIMAKGLYKKDGQTLMLRAYADKEGIVRLTLPFAGDWMISAVHMMPLVNDPDYRWDSFWANLTFRLADSAR